MGVVVCWDKNGGDMDALRTKCKSLAAKVKVE
jgi:phosphoribosylglycinamide formyltransferase 2